MPTLWWWIGVALFGAVIAWYVVDRERRQQKIVWYRALILVGLSALLVYVVGLLVGTIGHAAFVGVIARRTK
jgi:cell shape-determining protein MreD